MQQVCCSLQHKKQACVPDAPYMQASEHAEKASRIFDLLPAPDKNIWQNQHLLALDLLTATSSYAVTCREHHQVKLYHELHRRHSWLPI